MRVVAMVSGGKDSCYNMMQCVAEGHEIVALANLHPKDKDELDSYMYQTVGHMGIEMLAEAMGLPLYRMETKGQSTQIDKHYVPTDNDEVEDLYKLLKWTKDELNVEAVAVGAIFSDYQRVRVENVCNRLNLLSLSYLWRRDQTELLQEMIDCRVHAIVIKVAALGLKPELHLGKSLRDLQPYLATIHDKYGINVCGEGGEYETFTLDCPLFKQRIVIDEMQTIISSSDPICPVGYINFLKLHLEPKDPKYVNNVDVKSSLDYIKDLDEQSLSDFSDPESDEFIVAQDNDDGNPIQTLLASANTELSSLVLRNTVSAGISSKGWLWIGGIQGTGTNAANAMKNALTQLNDVTEANNYSLSNICYVIMYVKSMEEYGILNNEYLQVFNFPNPPTRVCVENIMPLDCHVILEAVGYRSPLHSEADRIRNTMHIQGISHWSPANIGPYSQATKVGDIVYVSGQIGLIPGSMKIIDGGFKQQCRLALRHIKRITKAMNTPGELRDVVQGICFVTDPINVKEARKQWERMTTNAIMDYIVVPALPRAALVEWQVWAHTHNDKFDYEETGCTIGDFNVLLRRRWDYENNCAAVISYTSIRPSGASELPPDEFMRVQKACVSHLTTEQLDRIFNYTIEKLLADCASNRKASFSITPTKPPSMPAVKVKVFYKLGCSVSPDHLFGAIDRLSRTNIVFTVLPAIHLQNGDTFISICAVRH